MDQLQDDLETNYPQLAIQILGMNQIGHEIGNAAITEGRDLPWLQDVDADQDGQSDVWLNSWDYAYRDVVIVDADNRPVTAYNLTTHDLSEPDNFSALRQLFLDAASLPTIDDAVQTFPGTPIDIDVLANDGGASGGTLSLTDVSAPPSGTAEIVTVQYAADLAPIQRIARPLVISEVRPGEYIELFNTRYQPLDLSDTDQLLATGGAARRVSELGEGLVAAPRGYIELDWPSEFSALVTATSGEVALFRDDFTGLDDATKLDDFVAWGTIPSNSRLAAALGVGQWIGDPAPPLTGGSIHRHPASNGRSAESYNTQLDGSGGAALGSQLESMQVVRFTPEAAFEGMIDFTYSVKNDQGQAGSATVRVEVLAAARPFTNPSDALDVDNDGIRAPRDALLIINALNRGFLGAVPSTLVAPFIGPPFLDCNGNNSVEPADVLQVINALNAPAESGSEGESFGDEPRIRTDGSAPPASPQDSLDIAPPDIAPPTTQGLSRAFAERDDDAERGATSDRSTAEAAPLAPALTLTRPRDRRDPTRDFTAAVDELLSGDCVGDEFSAIAAFSANMRTD